MNQPVSTTFRNVEQMLDMLQREVRNLQRGTFEDASAASMIRELIRHRRLREHFFFPGLFGEPAWDILLELAASRLERADVTVTTACYAAAVPTTTALRCINVLAAQQILMREADPTDKRRVLLKLTDKGWTAMQGYLERAGIRTGT